MAAKSSGSDEKRLFLVATGDVLYTKHSGGPNDSEYVFSAVDEIEAVKLAEDQEDTESLGNSYEVYEVVGQPRCLIIQAEIVDAS